MFNSAVDSFSNPGALVVIDCLSFFLSSFLNSQIQGVQHPRYLQCVTTSPGYYYLHILGHTSHLCTLEVTFNKTPGFYPLITFPFKTVCERAGFSNANVMMEKWLSL